MRWVGHMARMRQIRNILKILIATVQGKRKVHLGDVSVFGKVILKFILKNYVFRM
jgi:hypothetical protein